MIFHAKDGVRGQLFADMGDGEFRLVPCVVWYDDATLEFEAMRVSSSWRPFTMGSSQCIVKENGVPVRYQMTAARLHFVPNTQESANAASAGKARLLGGLAPRTSAVVRYNNLRPCEHPTCYRHRPHTYASVVEESVKDERGFEQTKLIKIRYFCDWHYKPPILVASTGEIMQTYEDVVRP